jgi:hypothetical protein
MELMEEIQKEFEEIMELERKKKEEKKKSPWWKDEQGREKGNTRPTKKVKKRDTRKIQKDEKGLRKITDWFKEENEVAEEEKDRKRLERKGRADRMKSEWLEVNMGMDWLESSQQYKDKDTKSRDWLEDKQEIVVTSSLDEEDIRMETYSLPEGQKGGEERLVSGRWMEGKRKRYEKGSCGRGAKERIKAGRAVGWCSSRMEKRRRKKGVRRLEQKIKEESKWLENLVDELMSDACRQGWKIKGDRFKRTKRLERAAYVKENWRNM